MDSDCMASESSVAGPRISVGHAPHGPRPRFRSRHAQAAARSRRPPSTPGAARACIFPSLACGSRTAPRWSPGRVAIATRGTCATLSRHQGSPSRRRVNARWGGTRVAPAAGTQRPPCCRRTRVRRSGRRGRHVAHVPYCRVVHRVERCEVSVTREDDLSPGSHDAPCRLRQRHGWAAHDGSGNVAAHKQRNVDLGTH